MEIPSLVWLRGFVSHARARNGGYVEGDQNPYVQGTPERQQFEDGWMAFYETETNLRGSDVRR